MAFVSLFNSQGLLVTPFSVFPVGPPTLSTTAMNAVGESCGFVGPIYLSSGPGTSKTISSAGGKIWVSYTAIVWATAGSTIRAGIQDVDATTGLEDGTFDVFHDLVQGVDALSSGSNEITMSSGTKTIANGDVIALVCKMTVRNGADSVAQQRQGVVSISPYHTNDIGGGLVKNVSGLPYCVIQFDDGTIGTFGDHTIICADSSAIFNNASSPDEYAMVFTVPFACKISTLYAKIGELDTGETGTVHLIEDPFGTDTNLVTVNVDPDLASTSSATDCYFGFGIAETELSIGVEYAISYRPTSANNRSLRLLTFPHADFLNALPVALSGASRTNLGAWTPSSTVMPDMGFKISQLDDGAGGSGGATSAAYLG